MKDMTRSTVLKLLGAIAASTIIISVIMVNIPWMGDVASEQKAPIVTMMNVSIVLSTFVFAVVMVAMIYAIWKYRAKPGDESDGEPIHGNTRLEIIWTAIPTVMVIGLAVASTIVLDDIEATAEDRPVRPCVRGGIASGEELCAAHERSRGVLERLNVPLPPTGL